MHLNHNNLLWWQKGVVYQIYPRSFMDTSGNGIGDLNGIIRKLDYLNDGTEKSLGIDAIWISPHYPSPMADFGYDVADYCDINPLFGDLKTFDLLIEEAHKRNIKIIVDFVPNHSSDQHPWFIESRASKDNPKRTWYIWRDKKNGGFPNNWGSAFGGPAWTWDENTQQFYFHQFLKEQPELNWREPALKSAMYDVLRFWMARGVDGFRMDVIAMILKDREMRDNPANPQVPANLPENDIFGRQIHLYNEDQDEVHEIMREIRQVLDERDECCAIGEIGYRLDRWVKYYGETGDELHMPFNFRLQENPWQAQAIRASVEALEAALPDFAWPNYVLGNHDNRRIASRFGETQARIAAMLLLTLRGTPTLYYGDEIGLPDGEITPENLQDPQGIRLGFERTRDYGRTPMQWDDSLHAGFSTQQPWLPVSADYRTRNVLVQDRDPQSMLNLVRSLIWYRKHQPVLLAGVYRSLDVLQKNCFGYERSISPKEKILVILNFSDQEMSVDILRDAAGKVVLSTYMDRQELLPLDAVKLRSNEGLLIEVIHDK